MDEKTTASLSTGRNLKSTTPAFYIQKRLHTAMK
jgi:hypothetical protein